MHIYKKKVHFINMEGNLQDVFINNLKFYRKEKNLSQEKLSEKLDKGMNYITKIECKMSFPTIFVIEEIANILEVPAAALFVKDGCPENLLLFDKATFMKDIICELSTRLKNDIEDVVMKRIR